MSADGFRRYGHRLIAGLQKHMPGEVITVYSEDDITELSECDSVILASLHFVPAFVNFTHRHAKSALVAGREERPGWKSKDREDGYSFRFDAMKFCRKVFAIADAARHLGHGVITWLDADAYPFRDVPADFFQTLGGASEFGCLYLGRMGTHSECGFLHFNIPEAMPLIQSWENFYASDRFLKEREWHDSYLFDLARGEVPSVRCISIAAPGARGHVWFDSPLGNWFEHAKGDRKKLGYSSERISRGL